MSLEMSRSHVSHATVSESCIACNKSCRLFNFVSFVSTNHLNRIITEHSAACREVVLGGLGACAWTSRRSFLKRSNPTPTPSLLLLNLYLSGIAPPVRGSRVTTRRRDSSREVESLQSYLSRERQRSRVSPVLPVETPVERSHSAPVQPYHPR